VLVTVGLVGKVSSAVTAHVRPIARVYVHVIIVATFVGEAFLTDAAHKGTVRVGGVVGQYVVPHLVLVALLPAVVTCRVNVYIVKVLVQLPLSLVLHVTLLALVNLF